MSTSVGNSPIDIHPLAADRKFPWTPSAKPPAHPLYSIPRNHRNAVNLPASTDLTPEMPAVYDQATLGSCHDGATEVLTRDGWKLFKDATVDDQLASVDTVTRRLIFEHPTRMVAYHYNGDIYRSTHQHLDFVVTPDHKMLVRKWNQAARTLEPDFRLTPMKDVGWYVGLMNSVDFAGTKPVGESVTIKGVDHKHRRQREDIQVPTVTWLRFLGIYVAEGTMLTTAYCKRVAAATPGVTVTRVDKEPKNTYAIQIAAAKPREKEFIRQILNDLGLKFVEFKDRFVFTNKRIYDALDALGLRSVKAPQKFVPAFIFDLGSDHIKEFILGHFMGDGCESDGVKSHYTSSTKLAEDLQRLIFLSGGWSQISTRATRTSTMKDGRIIRGRHPEHRVSVWNTGAIAIDRQAHVTTEPYDGMVYCAEVPTYHTLVTRRNGKILISGNCVENANGALYQFLLMKEGLPAPVPSRLFLYWATRAMEGDTGQDAGSNGDDCLTVMMTKGVPPESLWLYDVEQVFVEPPPVVWGAAWHHRVGGPVRIDDGDLLSVKSCLASGYPVAFGFTAYLGLQGQEAATTGYVPMPVPGEQSIGGHEILLVGYDDLTRRFKFRNSWGPSWGIHGYGFMSYEYVSDSILASDFRSASKAS